MSACRRLTENIPIPFAVAPPKRRTCIEQLADGWINPPDLCPACTARFMAALDGIDKPLSWHAGYVERAGQAVTS